MKRKKEEEAQLLDNSIYKILFPNHVLLLQFCFIQSNYEKKKEKEEIVIKKLCGTTKLNFYEPG